MKWKQKDGTEIEISDMTTDHIKNCIKMMDRKGGREYVVGSGGDIDTFGVFYEAYENAPIYKTMIKELIMRIK